MAEYIEREVALEAQNKSMNLAECRKRLERIPAADVRPVVHAIWRYKTMTVPGGKGQTYAKWSCTRCKGKFKERSNFCPNCGADMREVDNA